MEETRKYKQTELGLLPEDWEVVKLGEKVSSPCYGIGAEAISFNGVDKYLRITDISDEGHFAPNPLCSPAFFNEIHIAKENDLFVARTGASVGKTYLYNSKDGRLIFAGFLMKLNITDANSKFVFYYSQTNQYKNWVISESMRSGQPGLNLKQTMKLSIPLPPIEEQRRIASALTSIDNLIDSLDRLIAKKLDIKQGAMQQLLSGKKRLKGFTDKWETLLFKDIFTFLTTNTFARELLNIKGEIKNIHYGDILTNYCEILDVSKTDLPYIDSNKVTRYNPVILAKDGDIIIADTAEDEIVCKATEIYNIGNAKVVSGLHTMWCRPKNNIFAPKFLGYYLNSSMFHDQILPLIQGIKVSSVSKNSIKNTWISFPTISEQQAIASVLTSMDNELSALDAKCRKYEQIKQGMMQQLLTGRIRLAQ